MKGYYKLYKGKYEPADKRALWLKPTDSGRQVEAYFFGSGGWTRIIMDDMSRYGTGITYDSEAKTLTLTNSDGETLATIDATDFIKDGMLDSASFVTEDDGGNEGAFIHLVWNTDAGKEDMYIDVSLLIDIYTGGDAIIVDNNKISVVYDNSTIKLDESGSLYVVNALSDSEKSWIEDELFDTLYTVSIARSASSVVYSGSDYTVTWTLTTKYDGTLVDIDEDSIPSGWTWVSTGTYTKTTTVTSSTGSSVSSGSAVCTYNGRSKTASSVSCTNIKYSYILFSSDETLTSETLTELIEDGGVQMSTSNAIAGDYDLDIEEAGVYVFFAIANTSTLNSVTQLGLNYLSTDSTFPQSLTREGYGTYKVYRSSLTMGAGAQSVTVA